MKGLAAYVFVGIAFVLLGGTSVDATPLPLRKSRRPPATQSVQSLRAAGLSALSRGAFAEAAQQLEAAYRRAPDAEGLYLLCQLAWSGGQTLFAKDLARRYKAEIEAQQAGVAAPGHVAVSQPEVARILAFVDEPTGELAVLGPDGAFVLIDGQLAGQLPLPLPLLVSTGEHWLNVEYAQRSVKAHAKVPAGRLAEVRIQSESGSAVSTLIPVLPVWQEELGVPVEASSLLADAVASAASREHLSVTGWPAVPRSTSVAGCAQSLECLDELARQTGAALVLHARITGPQVGRDSGAAVAGWQLELRLFSGEIGELVSAKELRCEDCTVPEVAARLKGALLEALTLARTRPRGVIEVRSEPASAEVWSAGRRLGSTPYVRAAWTGVKPIELRLGRLLPWSGQAVVEEDKSSVLSIKLRPEPPPAPTSVVHLAEPPPRLPPRAAAPAPQAAESGRRPRWRLITGGVLLAGGVVLAGFGVSGLYVASLCSPDTPALATECRSNYGATPIGAALFGVGSSLSLSGVVLIALPGKRAAKPPVMATLALH